MPTQALEQVPSNRSECYNEVAVSLQKLLEAIPEVSDSYCEVTLPNGDTIPADNETLSRLSSVQLLRASIENLREQLEQPESSGARERYYKEQALALTEEGVRHLEGFLAIQADLASTAVQDKNSARLSEVLYTVARTLLSENKNFRSTEID